MSALFLSVFLSTTWLIYALNYLSAQAGEGGFSSLKLPEFILYTVLIFAPIWLIWYIYGLVMRALHERETIAEQSVLLGQIKKNLDYTDLTARVLLEAQSEIKNGFVVQKFDIFVADLNELLVEIAQGSNAMSTLETEKLWNRVKNGERWVIGKAFLEAVQNADDFSVYLAQKAAKDSIFKGTIREFCSRYQNLCALLEKHDKEHVFIHILETGVMGKVYSVLAPVAEAESALSESITISESHREIRFEAEEKTDEPDDEDETFFSKLREKMEEPDETPPNKTEEPPLPRLDASLTGENLQEKKREEKEIAYPFGGWMNDEDSQN